jgi:hypothetical protein
MPRLLRLAAVVSGFAVWSLVGSSSLAQAPEPASRAAATKRAPPEELDRYDVVFTTPGPDERASMPVGNGMVGANVWTTPEGGLRLYVARLDAHSETQRLLKLARIDLSWDPPLDFGAERFEQRLKLSDGRLELRSGEGETASALFVFVDPAAPIIHVAGTSASPRKLNVETVVLRPEKRVLRGAELKTSWVLRDAPADVVVEESADHVLDDPEASVVAHRNAWSCTPLLIERQRLGADAALVPDPLADLTFGVKVAAAGCRPTTATRLAAAEPATRIDVRIAAHTNATPDLATWKREIDAILAGADAGRAYGRAAAWWRERAARSYVFVDEPPPAAVRCGPHPLRIGANSRGGDVFPGAIAAYDFAARAWTTEEIIARAAVPPEAAAAASRPAFAGAPIDVPDAEAPPRDAAAFSVGAWVLPSGDVGRIFDRITPGGVDGFLLDLQGGKPRLVVGAREIRGAAALPAGRFSHVAAVVAGADGPWILAVDGREVARYDGPARGGADDPRPPSAVTQAWLLARYVGLASSRASRPIPFQGGMFTIAAHLTPNGGRTFRGPADDRNWGVSVWWQNARLVHRPFLAQGEPEAVRPLLDFYLDRAPLFRAQARRLYGAAGLFVFETLSLCGLPGMGDWGWTPVDPPAYQEPYTRRIWQQPLEIAEYGLDLYAHDGDARRLVERTLPWADDALRFFLAKFGRDAAGRLVITPSHAVETYWEDVVNDLPSVAGLRSLVRRMERLAPEFLPPERRALLQEIAAALPPIPRRVVDGRELFAAAERHEPTRRNVEAPELYGVFPFRAHDLSGPDLDVARATYARMQDPGRTCWHQTGIFAARLGLADEAAEDVLARSRQTAAGFRFPGFFGSPYDWAPDLDGAGNLQTALQEMLVQEIDGRIVLLPAWPTTWSARFRLHASGGTILEGEVRRGRLVRLDVDPPERAKDVVGR